MARWRPCSTGTISRSSSPRIRAAGRRRPTPGQGRASGLRREAPRKGSTSSRRTSRCGSRTRFGRSFIDRRIPWSSEQYVQLRGAPRTIQAAGQEPPGSSSSGVGVDTGPPRRVRARAFRSARALGIRSRGVRLEGFRRRGEPAPQQESFSRLRVVSGLCARHWDLQGMVDRWCFRHKQENKAPGTQSNRERPANRKHGIDAAAPEREARLSGPSFLMDSLRSAAPEGGARPKMPSPHHGRQRGRLTWSRTPEHRAGSAGRGCAHPRA